MDFEQWMEKVDAEFISCTGIDRDSWPDSCYWDNWDSGFSPREAMIEAILSEYGEEGLDAFGLLEEYENG